MGKGDQRRTGVVLLGMGGPAGLAGVEPFLENLFSDPAILPLPDALRPRIARLIARRRAPSACERYRLLGGVSPIHAFTETQAEALGERLGPGYVVRHAFRYVDPRAERVCGELADAGVSRVVGLSTYPQRSHATIDSSLAEFERHARGRGLAFSAVTSYPVDAGFIRALACAAREALDGAGPGVHLLMVAHAIPKRSVRRGDPYVGEVERTAGALARSLPRAVPWSLCYQSRLGPAGWVGPSVEQALRRVARAGTDGVVLVPLSFTSEHLETLVELDLEMREKACEAGIGRFHRAPVPGMHPAFLAMLERLVHREVERG
jgi:ferrochelatase